MTFNFRSNTKKVVILAPRCGDIEQSIARAFRILGWDAAVMIYGDVNPRHLVERALFSIFPENRQEAIQKDFNVVISNQLLPSVIKDKPSFVLVLKGHRLEEQNKTALQNLDIPIVTWAYDSLSRCPESSDIINISTQTFYIDGDDVPEGDGNATWLPLGYDETIFRSDPEQDTEYDVLLIGALRKQYSRRRHFLKMLSESRLAKEWKIAFIGSTGKRINDLRLNLNPAVTWIGKRLPMKELAHNISKAKICINIHQDDGVKPINPMFFAIPGAGACQMAESKSYFNSWMSPGIDYVSFNDDSFIEKLSVLLSNDELRKSIAHSGMNRVLKEHTYVHRVKSICMQLERTV